MIARLSSSYRRASGFGGSEEKAEIAKRRKQKVQVAHQVADRIKECERYERQIAEERDRVRPPTEESRLLQTEFLEAVLAVSREKDVRLGIDDRTHGAPAADPETGEPDVSLIEPIELDRWTSHRETRSDEPVPGHADGGRGDGAHRPRARARARAGASAAEEQKQRKVAVAVKNKQHG